MNMKKDSGLVMKIFLGIVAILGLVLTAFGVAAVVFGVGGSQAKGWVFSGPMIIGLVVFYYCVIFVFCPVFFRNTKERK